MMTAASSGIMPYDLPYEHYVWLDEDAWRDVLAKKDPDDDDDDAGDDDDDDWDDAA
jgi:hypothetical protein